MGLKTCLKKQKKEHFISRVLSWMTIYLKAALRRLFRDRTRGSAGSVIPLYSVLLRTGFAWRENCFSPGGLLPHLFTLTLAGGMFLWHFPLVRTNWGLPSVLPCGARTFLPSEEERSSEILPLHYTTENFSTVSRA